VEAALVAAGLFSETLAGLGPLHVCLEVLTWGSALRSAAVP
jgi:hypothetical protein